MFTIISRTGYICLRKANCIALPTKLLVILNSSRNTVPEVGLEIVLAESVMASHQILCLYMALALAYRNNSVTKILLIKDTIIDIKKLIPNNTCRVT